MSQSIEKQLNKVVVVGGGTAGWLTAAIVAAERRAQGDVETSVVLVESPDVPIIGVGEGTWPSMRRSLQRIGVSERQFLAATGASFKQGTRFVGWSGREGLDSYDHPFSAPVAYSQFNLASVWLSHGGTRSFAEFVSSQSALIDAGFGPKQASTPDYAFAVNYGYHLDAGKFAVLLKEHAVEKLGVEHVLANVTGVKGEKNSDIEGVVLDDGSTLHGTLFVDCTGHRALLIGEHYQIGFLSAESVLFNDRAIAVQVPHAQKDSSIASATLSTATTCGWIWDIALQERRGLGHVFSSKFSNEEDAQDMLAQYVAGDEQLESDGIDDNAYRTLNFSPGYRSHFWHKNCVAVGLSAGFIEPLEASAIALVEQSASMIAEQLPQDREIMDVVASRYNDKLAYHWQRIIEFLKLHYVLSARRDSEYWRAHVDPESWPHSLRQKLVLWQQQPPYHVDAPMIDELFPSASYQYVLYGMGFRPAYEMSCVPSPAMENALHDVQVQRDKFLNGLTANRTLINEILGK